MVFSPVNYQYHSTDFKIVKIYFNYFKDDIDFSYFGWAILNTFILTLNFGDAYAEISP